MSVRGSLRYIFTSRTETVGKRVVSVAVTPKGFYSPRLFDIALSEDGKYRWFGWGTIPPHKPFRDPVEADLVAREYAEAHGFLYFEDIDLGRPLDPIEVLAVVG